MTAFAIIAAVLAMLFAAMWMRTRATVRRLSTPSTQTNRKLMAVVQRGYHAPQFPLPTDHEQPQHVLDRIAAVKPGRHRIVHDGDTKRVLWTLENMEVVAGEGATVLEACHHLAHKLGVD